VDIQEGGSMTRIILIYGAIGAAVVGGLMVFGFLSWTPEQKAEGMDNGLVVGYLTQIVALTTVFLGIKHFRDKERGGVVKFLPAFLVGLGISAVASLGWIIGWEIVLATGFDFEAMMTQLTRSQAVAAGLAGEALEQKLAENQAFMTMYMDNPLVRLPMTFIEMFPVGVIISLISALLLRNSRFMPARQAVAQ
jgi:TRAP-type C4-dicarboxylate transport system permease large subunit